jgi:hypothetical protein
MILTTRPKVPGLDFRTWGRSPKERKRWYPGRPKKKEPCMRTIWFLIYVLGTTGISWAQGGPASWQSLNTLQAGEKIQVLEGNSRKVSGRFLNVSEAAISVQDQAGSQAIQRQDVRSVKLMKNKHRLRNTFIGAGLGAGVGAVAGGSVNNGFISRGVFAAAVAAAFSLPGAVVGALVPDHTTVYNVGSH